MTKRRAYAYLAGFILMLGVAGGIEDVEADGHAACVAGTASQCQWRMYPSDAVFIAPDQQAAVHRGYSDLDVRTTQGASADRCVTIQRDVEVRILTNRCDHGVVGYLWYER